MHLNRIRAATTTMTTTAATAATVTTEWKVSQADIMLPAK